MDPLNFTTDEFKVQVKRLAAKADDETRRKLAELIRAKLNQMDYTYAKWSESFEQILDELKPKDTNK